MISLHDYVYKVMTTIDIACSAMKEIQNSDDLKKEFATAFKEGNIEGFLKDNECDASVEDVKNYLDNIKNDAASDDDLAIVAGGCFSSTTCVTCDVSVGDCCPSVPLNDKFGVC